MKALKTFFAALLFALLLPSLSLAQDETVPNYETWAAVAERAEAAIEASRASNTALEELRSQITDWRQQFLTAQETNGERVETLRSQIKALGPAPAEGEAEEAEEIATRRAELTAQLSRLEAPIVKAEEAFSRADGMIGEIDRIIRERQTDALFMLGPTPLNPANWSRAWSELNRSWNGIASEWVESWHNPAQRITLRDHAPAVLGLIVLGLALLVQGRRWMKNIGRQIRVAYRVHGYLWHFLISLGQVVLPMAGIFALTEAVSYSSLGGPRTLILLEGLPFWAGFLIVGQWLAGLIFAEDEHDAIYSMGDDRNRRARQLTLGLTVILALNGAISAMAAHDFYPGEARVVIGLPLIVLASLFLFRLARMLTAYWSVGDADGTHSNRLLPYFGRVIQLAAILSPILAIVGYEAAANALIYPAIRSLGPVGLVIVLKFLVAEAYVLITKDQDGHEALVPMLMGYLLVLAAIPGLALIWGARLADLSEVWASIQQGVHIGETRISPTEFLSFILVFVAGYMLTRILQGALRSSVLPKTRIDTGGQNAIVSGIGYVGIFLAAVIAISSAGIDLSSLAIVAGALSVGIGFGLQNIVSNFVSGIILLIERPISQGDWIEVGGKHGYVRGISVRSTRVETFDRTDLIIPNSDLVSGQVINWTRGNVRGRVIVPVGVAYGTDTKRVETILREIAEAHPMVSDEPPPSVFFQGFGASSLDFEIRAILTDVNWILNVKSDINHEIARRFTEEGIEIPFHQTDVTIRNIDALKETSE